MLVIWKLKHFRTYINRAFLLYLEIETAPKICLRITETPSIVLHFLPHSTSLKISKK